jgi:type II secretory pathway component PulL
VICARIDLAFSLSVVDVDVIWFLRSHNWSVVDVDVIWFLRSHNWSLFARQQFTLKE